MYERDRQTDTHTAWRQKQRLMLASRDKNAVVQGDKNKRETE